MREVEKLNVKKIREVFETNKEEIISELKSCYERGCYNPIRGFHYDLMVSENDWSVVGPYNATTMDCHKGKELCLLSFKADCGIDDDALSGLGYNSYLECAKENMKEIEIKTFLEKIKEFKDFWVHEKNFNIENEEDYVAADDIEEDDIIEYIENNHPEVVGILVKSIIELNWDTFSSDFEYKVDETLKMYNRSFNE